MQITITVQDDGRITVETDAGGEPYECSSVDECLDYVRGEMTESGEQDESAGEENAEAMWNEEADRRAAGRAQSAAFE